MVSQLHELAPRLARARDAWVAWEAQRRAWTIWHTHQVLKLERLVAHRDLQLCRALATGKGGYIDRRRQLLEKAQRDLDRFQRMEPPS